MPIENGNCRAIVDQIAINNKIVEITFLFMERGVKENHFRGAFIKFICRNDLYGDFKPREPICVGNENDGEFTSKRIFNKADQALPPVAQPRGDILLEMEGLESGGVGFLSEESDLPI